MMKLYLTRHGETEWNLTGKFQGRLDSPLTSLGREQAQWLQQRLANVPFDAIYSSNLGRALETAKILSTGHAVPIYESEAIQEIDLGAFQGLEKNEVIAGYGEAYHAFWNAPHTYRPVGGETYEELKNRAVTFVEGIAAVHAGQTVLVVTHGVALKMLLSHYMGVPLEKLWEPPFIQNTSLSVVNFSAETVAVEKSGCIRHYPDCGTMAGSTTNGWNLGPV